MPQKQFSLISSSYNFNMLTFIIHILKGICINFNFLHWRQNLLIFLLQVRFPSSEYFNRTYNKEEWFSVVYQSLDDD